MENRVFSRIVVDIPSCIYVTLNDDTRLEILGLIHNISASGIQIRISLDDYADMVKKLCPGDVVGFQAVDEYKVINDERADIIDGDGEVVWINSNENEIMFGCKVNNVNPEYLTYIKQKKLSLYFTGRHDISISK